MERSKNLKQNKQSCCNEKNKALGNINNFEKIKQKQKKKSYWHTYMVWLHCKESVRHKDSRSSYLYKCASPFPLYWTGVIILLLAQDHLSH